jgi:tRNA(fMet)-specific endonuclease VapC
VSFWVLDTDHLSLLQRGYSNIIKRINSVDSQDIFVTIITFEEQIRGRMNSIKQAETSNKLIFAYSKLRETLEDFKTLNLLDFEQNAYNCYLELLRQKIRIGTQDLKIAAIVISHNAILVTRNRRDFEKVSGLRFEDWTIDESLY